MTKDYIIAYQNYPSLKVTKVEPLNEGSRLACRDLIYFPDSFHRQQQREPELSSQDAKHGLTPPFC